MELEDAGYSFTVDSSGTTVTGTYKVGNMTMKVSFDSNGKMLYTADGYNGEPTSNVADIYKWFVE